MRGKEIFLEVIIPKNNLHGIAKFSQVVLVLDLPKAGPETMAYVQVVCLGLDPKQHG